MKYRTPMPTIQYRFLSKKQEWVWLAAKAFCFVNPYSQQVEYIIFTNVLLRYVRNSYDLVQPKVEQEMYGCHFY